MVIDVHAHVIAPAELYAYKAWLLSSRGAHGRGNPQVPPERLRECVEQNIAIMDSVGTDIQLLSPRPFQLMHSEQPASVVRWWIQANNDLIAEQVRLFPQRLRGVAALPQAPSLEPAEWLDELDRAVNELGFVGCLVNPDPSEGTGYVPPMGDEYWYPLYERLVELDVPAIIHSAGCKNGRESYSAHFITEESIAVLSLLNSRVFLDFPTLKIIVCHGGGSVPYQAGRWRAARLHPRLGEGSVLRESFDESLRRLYYDTALYDPLALELLFKTVGPDRCLFGTEKPGSGSARDPNTGRDFDDLKPTIESIAWLSEEQRKLIFEDNARKLFSRLDDTAR